MKKLSHLFIVFALCLLALSGLHSSALNSSIRDEYISETTLIEQLKSCSSDFYRNTLTDEKEIALYDKIETVMFYCRDEYPFFFTDDETVNKISLYVCLDNPFLTITNQYYETQTENADSTLLEKYLGTAYLPFQFVTDDYYGKMAEVYRTAQSIVSAMPTGQTDYEKALYLHDYIVTSVRYTYDYSDTDADNAYGALMNHRARCEGYTDAYAILLNIAGIDATKVMYFGSDTNSEAGHIWNMLSLDGSWYQSDSTNDSFGADADIPSDYTSYAYFLISTADILNSYPINSQIADLIPPCDNDTNNFFQKNSLYFTEYNRYDVGKAAGRFLKNQLAKGLNGVSVKFSSKEAYQKALSSDEIPYLLSIISDYDGAKAYYYNYFYNDEQLVITFFTEK